MKPPTARSVGVAKEASNQTQPSGRSDASVAVARDSFLEQQVTSRCSPVDQTGSSPFAGQSSEPVHIVRTGSARRATTHAGSPAHGGSQYHRKDGRSASRVQVSNRHVALPRPSRLKRPVRRLRPRRVSKPSKFDVRL